MKRISKGYYKAASRLTLWAVLDMLAYFAEIVIMDGGGFLDFLQIVRFYPYIAGAKVLIAGLILAVAAVRVKLNRKIRATTAVTWLVVGAVFASWGLGMYCVTSVVAQDFASSESHSQAYSAIEFAKMSSQEEASEVAAIVNEYDSWWWAYRDRSFVDLTPPQYLNAESGFFALCDSDASYLAIAVFDNTGKLITASWEDSFFVYCQKEMFWRGGDPNVDQKRMRVAFDRNKLTEAGKERITKDGALNDSQAVRFTGWYGESGFVLQKVEHISKKAYYDASNKTSPLRSFLDLLDSGLLQWELLYEDPQAVSPNGEYECLYADGYRTEFLLGVSSPAFSYKGEQYESTADYVRKVGPLAQQGNIVSGGFENGELFYAGTAYCISWDGEIRYAPYYLDSEGVERHYYVVSMVYSRPWLAAMGQLVHVYITGFLLALGLTVLLCRLIRRNMAKTLQEAIQTLDSTNEHRTYINDISDEWYESQQLIDCLEKNRILVWSQKQENNRLTTALEYAKSAEEQRRRMTSNIAHELKTPLAVIHSYAEGLKEHIAEEKRDKYVDVILSEVKRTDAMVLEMLDLSRLEAGKVKLAQDRFSLIDMTRSIFDRLELAANAKELTIEFDFPKALDIVADESRMAQVIENLATNAVKYTPDGGKIRVEGYSGRKGTVFTIENDSEPLSKEALDKVWDVFYRADEARSGGGTGLGLAITKTIVELHGGKCSVQNTKTGVKFGFTI